MQITIAIDGTAASGKGTIARAVAKHFACLHFDTGALYRYTALRSLEAKFDLLKETANLNIFFDDFFKNYNNPKLRTEEIGRNSAIIAQNKIVRENLLLIQRKFIKNVLENGQGIVLDGRDIGTVVIPDADAKLFVTANLNTRAKRRYDELRSEGSDIEYQTVEDDLRLRDARDSGRADAPLRQAADADLLDTSDLTIAAAIQRAIALVEARMKR